MLAEKLQEAAGNGTTSTPYVDDVFSTWLYTGNGSTQTITNGIDLAGQGGMTWIKSRSAATDHKLTDTVRGATKALISDTTGAQTTDANGLTAFSSTGFSIGTDSVYNTNAATYASWTFRKAAKFFDVQTITHTFGTANTIDLSALGTVGMVIAKNTTTTGDWDVWHRSLPSGNSVQLNTVDPYSTTYNWISVSGTTATFKSTAPAGTYIIYAFAHDTASDGIIQCGTFTTPSSAGDTTVTLGWQPQYALVKRTTGSGGDWYIQDTMRGMIAYSYAGEYLRANLANAASSSSVVSPLGNGFISPIYALATSSEYIYMAIRMPNKPPTSGTQVYYPVSRSGTGATGSSTSFGQVTDLVFTKQRGSTQTWAWTDRVRGATLELTSAGSTAEATYANDLTGFDIMTGFYFGSGASGQMNSSGSTYSDNLFRRAPGFFDITCYSFSGTAGVVYHNLGAIPELIIQIKRSTGAVRAVYNSTLGFTQSLFLDMTNASTNFVNSVDAVSATSFTQGTWYNGSTSATMVAYLFATLAGISKVGSYTGNGTTQTINCGFTGGARFVLIKRTDSTGDWYVFDTARGMTTLTDPYLLLNSTAAEVATLGAVTSVTTGFAVNAAIVAAINTNAASYIYLSIA